LNERLDTIFDTNEFVFFFIVSMFLPGQTELCVYVLSYIEHPLVDLGLASCVCLYVYSRRLYMTWVQCNI